MSALLREVSAPVPETIHLPNVEWCELTSIGLKVIHKNASYEEMESTLDQLMVVAKGSPLAVGDAMSLGEKRHGDKWAQAVDANKKTGIKVKTLLEYRRVSENVPFSIRMENPNVEWSHYQIIANQPKADRRQWVKMVAENGWTVAELRKEIRGAAGAAVIGDDKNYLDPQYKQFLLDYIATQYSFLNRCTYEPFKREIEHSIKAARYQHGRSLKSDYEAVRGQVDEGCATADDVMQEVFLSEKEIKDLFALIMEKEPETYEWRPVGVNTDMARGSRLLGIFRKDAPSGDDFNAGYRPRVEYDNEEDHY